MWLDFRKEKVGKLKSPRLIVSVSTSMAQYRALYSQGRELADHLLRSLKLEEVAEIHASGFPPEVIVKEDGTASLPACKFYLHRGSHDLLLLAGDSSPGEDQYEFAKLVLDYAEEMGVTELYSVGARWSDNPLPPEQEPEVKGFSTDSKGVAGLERAGVKVLRDEPAPFFASMVVSMAAEHGIRGYKLSVDHGEPRPHKKSVAQLVRVLSELSGVKLPLDGLGTDSPSVQRAPGDGSIYH